VVSLVAELLQASTVIETAASVSTVRGRGRPGTLVALNPHAGAVVGIDFGHRHIRACLTNLARDVLASTTVKHPERTSWTRRANLALDLVKTLIAQSSAGIEGIRGIGAGVVGPVDEYRARADTVRRTLHDAFGVPVLVDNNTRLAALAELWGRPANGEHILYLKLSYGVGGALLLDRQPYRGAAGAAGELGHSCVDIEGPSCWCGRRGCLECYASIPAVLSAWQPHRRSTIAQLHQALAGGDDTAWQAVQQAGALVGDVLAHACNAMNPDEVVLAGELIDPGGVLMRSIDLALRNRCLPIVYRSLTIRRARLGNEDGALGGVALVLASSEPPGDRDE
jgi:predicted NBD/HSP70 family sugar kinase